MQARPPAVILAGGLGSRMGGGDKALRNLAGRPILAHVIAALAPQCGALWLNANGDPARFARFGLPVLADPVPGHPGPLAGVLAGLTQAAATGAHAIVTAPADTPFLPADLVARLCAAASDTGLAIAASPDATGTLRHHPTCALWPTRLHAPLRRALAAGHRRVGAFAEAHGAAIAAFPAPPDPFFNINTPADLATAEARAAAGAG